MAAHFIAAKEDDSFEILPLVDEEEYFKIENPNEYEICSSNDENLEVNQFEVYESPDAKVDCPSYGPLELKIQNFEDETNQMPLDGAEKPVAEVQELKVVLNNCDSVASLTDSTVALDMGDSCDFEHVYEICNSSPSLFTAKMESESHLVHTRLSSVELPIESPVTTPISTHNEERRICKRTFSILSRRNHCNKSICKIFTDGFKVCDWIQKNKFICGVTQKIRISVDTFINVVGSELNAILSSSNPLQLTILSDDISAKAIKDAFSEVFHGQVDVFSFNLMLNSGPVLPVGLASGIESTEMKVNYARRFNLTPTNGTVISTSSILHQSTAERWHLSTVIYIDDPALNLNLHNFSATVPIPNKYVTEAQRLTSESYPLRQHGLAASIDQAIRNLSGLDFIETHEFLTGRSSYSSTKSGALTLAGMYKQYLNERTH